MPNKPLYLAVIAFLSFACSCQKAGSPSTPTISNITITSLTPTHGPYNTIDTLTGKGFDQLLSLDSVDLNGQRVTIIGHNDQQIIFQIPSLAGTGHIDIWSKGTEYEGPVFTYDSVLMVTTVAGSSTDFGEVDGKGLDARFYRPWGIAVDHSGNIYVADMGGSCIRKIDTGANVTTIAGPQTYEEAYVDGTGAAARFALPLGLCIDQRGSLYVADRNNFRVRKVSPVGVVTTFAGTMWDGIPKDGSTDGNASAATFDTPWGVVCDSAANIFVADIYNNKIRKITASGIVSSFAGGDYYHGGFADGQGSAAQFSGPSALTIDPYENLFVVDATAQSIRKVTPDGTVSTLLGPAFHDPTNPDYLLAIGAIASDKDGNIYFTAFAGILKMTPNGQIIRYAVGGVGDLDGPASVATYREISGMTFNDKGTLYITDNNRVRKIAWQ
jgi:sugar lactone lactonase YvrE